MRQMLYVGAPWIAIAFIYLASELIGPSNPLNMLSGFLYIFQLLAAIRIRPLIAMILPVWYSFIWLGLSAIYLDTGAYAPELSLLTSEGSSSAAYFFYQGYFLFILSIFLPKSLITGEKPSYLPQALESLVYGFIILLIVVLIVNGIIYGFPLFLASQRFVYWANHPIGSLLSKALAFSAYLFIYIGWRLTNRKEPYLTDLLSLKRWLFAILALCTLGLLYGNKASFFLVCLFSYLGSSIAFNKRKLNPFGLFKSKKVIFTLTSLSCILTVAGFFYVYVHSYTYSELDEIIFSRLFAMQAQLWWGIYNFGINQIEFSSILYKGDGMEPYGIFALMQNIMPDNSFSFYFASLIPLTGGFPAVFISSMPPIFVFPAIGALSIITALIVKGTAVALICGRILFLVWIFLIASLSWILTLGSLNILIDELFVIAVVIIFVSHIFTRRESFDTKRIL